MESIASQITSLTIVYSIIYSDNDQRKHQSFASLSFVRGIHPGPVNSPHKWPVTRKMFPFDEVIMCSWKYNTRIIENQGETQLCIKLRGMDARTSPTTLSSEKSREPCDHVLFTDKTDQSDVLFVLLTLLMTVTAAWHHNRRYVCTTSYILNDTVGVYGFSHPPLNEMSASSHMIFSNAFSCMKSSIFWLMFLLKFVPRGPINNNPAIGGGGGRGGVGVGRD